MRLTASFVRRTVALSLAIAFAASSVLPALAQDTASPAAGAANLAAVKAYSVSQIEKQKAATAQLRPIVQRYYDLAQSTNFDYQDLWQTNKIELAPLLEVVKQQWLIASTAYEFNEGIVAGVPSLSYYDTWLDAGPSAAEDPEGALDWTLKLPDGRELVKPGNFFTHLTEPALYGTVDDFVGLRVDMNGDGKQEFGEVLPEANVFYASFVGLDDATTQLQDAINAWEPTIEDAFSALTTMIPTINQYFEQWKVSRFVTGDASTETAFVAVSRLSDINGIFHGLDVTYDEISPVVAATDANLDSQIKAGFNDLVTFVSDLNSKESGGARFTPEQAELFGAEAQDRATTLVGLVSQAVALLGLQI